MNPLLIKTRSLARKLGLISVLKRLMPQRDYEEKFNAALLGAIRPGDIVWDIGANVGFYTVQFAEAVGTSGRVVAFEPAPESITQLEGAVAGCKNVTIKKAAVADARGVSEFGVETGEASVTNTLDVDKGGKKVTVSVEVTTVDWEVNESDCPNIMKIDVEGFEGEVFDGMETTLANPFLRGIFCEVHFSVLERRGKANTPAKIETILRKAGFNVQWVGHSHISAIRGGKQ